MNYTWNEIEPRQLRTRKFNRLIHYALRYSGDLYIYRVDYWECVFGCLSAWRT